MRTIFVVSILRFLTGCGLSPRQAGSDILIIGDSVFAWNRSAGRDMGAVIGTELQREVVSRATLGARLSGSNSGPFRGSSIPEQLSAGPWNWIVMNGGANDLGFSCGCIRCDAEIDMLISRDATTGAIPALVDKAQRLGAKVLWVGYYKAPKSKAFGGCRPALVELELRIAAYAQANNGVFFIDAEDVLDPNTPGLFALDKTHPSASGSSVIGRFVAAEIAKQSLPQD